MDRLTPKVYLNLVKDIFEELGQPEVAEKQMKYMRNQFDFYGLKAPVWLPKANEIMKAHGIPDEK